MQITGTNDEFMFYGMLFSLCNRIQTIGDSQFKDITMKQHFMMVALGIFGEEAPTLKETGELIGCSYQNVKRMAVQLEKNGYLHIVQDENDKRKLRLIKTDKFEQFEQESRLVTGDFMKKLYCGVNKEELKIALETLKKMDHNLGGVVY